MNPVIRRIIDIEQGTNIAFIENQRRRLNAGAGVVVNDAFWRNAGDIAVGIGPGKAGRITPGTNGQYLKADSTDPTGYSWDTPSGGSGAKTATFVIGPSGNADSSTYDYTTDGTDDDVEIQAAIEALPATGGKIVLREGTYTISQQIECYQTSFSAAFHLTIVGTGGGTKLQPKASVGSNFDMFNASANNFVMKDIYFNGSTNTTDTINGVSINALGSRVEGCWFVDMGGFCVEVDNAGYGDEAVISDCYFKDWGRVNTFSLAISELEGGVTDCIFDTDEIDAGVMLGAGRLTRMTSCTVILPGGHEEVVFSGGGRFVNCHFVVEGAADNGHVMFNGSSDDTQITNCIIEYVSLSDQAAITFLNCTIVTNCIIENAGKAIDTASAAPVIISNNAILGCNSIAIQLDSDNAHVINNLILDASAISDGGYDAIVISANSDRCVVTGNRVRSQLTNQPRYGISIVSGATNNIVDNNIVTDCATSSINDAGTGTIGTNITS